MNSTVSELLQRRRLAILVLVFAAIWFGTLGARKLLNPDEGRYAEIPREMLVSGDWLSPHLNNLKYFEKPPLQYWATAVAYQVFGESEFASRLWCGLTGFAAILFTGWAGSRLFGRNTGLAAAALLGCSLMQMLVSHINTLDSAVSFFMIAAVFSFLLAQHAPLASKLERNWMLTAWAMAALGMMSKGLEAVALPGLTFIVYSIVTRDVSAWKRLHIVVGLAVFVIVAAPWFIAMSIANPEFAHYFFIHEHFERFLTTVHERDNPWWWFFLWLPVGALPWISIAFFGLHKQWQQDKQTNSADGFHPRQFLIVWVAVILLFFSTSHSKLIPYILPAIPALALLGGDSVVRISVTSLQRHLLGIAVLWAIAVGYTLFGPLATGHDAPPELMRKLFNWGACAFALMSCGGLLALYFARREHRLTAVVALSLCTLSGASVLLFGIDTGRAVTSGYDLAQTIAPHVIDARPFYSVNDYDQTLPFYLKHTMTLVGYQGTGEKDLDFGQSQEPHKRLPDVAAFKAKWQTDPAGSIAVIENKTYKMLAAQHLPMTVIGKSIQMTAVQKPTIQLTIEPAIAPAIKP